MHSIASERRSCGRYEVEWPAEVLLNGSATVGVVRDLGDRGAFIDVSSIGHQLSALEIEELPDIGDRLFISYTLRPFARSVRRRATLRWIGRHPTRRWFGLGVQFEVAP